MATYENHFWVVPDLVMIYTRARSSKYQVRIKNPNGGYVVKSTGQKSQVDAIQSAIKLYGEMTYKIDRNLPLKDYTFRDLFEAWWKVESGSKSKHRVTFVEGTVKRYLIPYFQDELKNIKVSALTDADFDDYFKWRNEYWKTGIGKKHLENAAKRKNNHDNQRHSKLGNVAVNPAYKSLQMEQSLIKQIFYWAHRRDMVDRLPYVKAPKPADLKNKEKSRRPSFEQDEWMTLVKYMRDWVKDETYQKQPKRNHRFISDSDKKPTRVHKLHRFQREMCRHYVLFMGQTGLRPNEARQMLWRDMKYNERANRWYVQVRETTKTGERAVYGHQNWVETLNRLRTISPFNKEDDLVFVTHKGTPPTFFGKTFKKILTDLDMLKDSYGRDRTIYSLRHFFATMRLRNGEMTMEQLADAMGSSIVQIYKHYRHENVHKAAEQHSYSKPKRQTQENTLS